MAERESVSMKNEEAKYDAKQQEKACAALAINRNLTKGVDKALRLVLRVVGGGGVHDTRA
jgi:hypothetical protein